MSGVDGSDVSTVLEDEPPARRWGDLHLRRVIDEGAFGTVYVAWDPKLETDVALKVLKPDRATASGDLLTEARRLARVRHPHVVTVHGADVVDGSVGFWMELLRGETVDRWLQVRGPMSAGEASVLGIAMAQALAAVHATGIVHGDVKDRNVIREHGGRYVLTDFGAARRVAASSGDSSFRITGTPRYMAPEVLRGAPPTPAADIYGLGVVLYHCVTEGFPVGGSTMDEVRAAHAQGVRTRLRDARPDLPAPFVAVVERALSPQPDERFGTAGEMELALSRASGHAPGLSVGLAAVGLLAAIAVVAGGAYYLRAPAAGTAAANLTEVRTVAVLPFATGGQSDIDTRGFTDLLTSRLSEITSLRVVSQTSAQQVHAQPRAARETARLLGADALIEGAVHVVANRVRVDVRLVDAAIDSVAWSQSLEGELDRLLELQADVARAVGGRLRGELTAGERERLADTETSSLAAQHAYLEGWSAFETQTLEGTRQAIRSYQAAIALDPTYARAHGMLSYAYWYLGVGLEAMPFAQSRQLAEAAAATALRLDPRLPRAHIAAGQVAFYFDWDWAAADDAFSTAISLNPSDADGHVQYGWFLAAQGRMEQAVQHMRRARELDPLSPSRRSPLAAVHYYAGMYEQAVQELLALRSANPEFRATGLGLARSYSALGRPLDALRELEAVRTDSSQFLAELARVHAQAGQPARARAILADLEARRAKAPQSVRLEALAYLYAALGMTETAVELIQAAYEQRSPALLWIRVDPRYNALRADPGFRSVLRAMQLEE